MKIIINKKNEYLNIYVFLEDIDIYMFLFVVVVGINI